MSDQLPELLFAGFEVFDDEIDLGVIDDLAGDAGLLVAAVDRLAISIENW